MLHWDRGGCRGKCHLRVDTLCVPLQAGDVLALGLPVWKILQEQGWKLVVRQQAVTISGGISHAACPSWYLSPWIGQLEMVWDHWECCPAVLIRRVNDKILVIPTSSRDSPFSPSLWFTTIYIYYNFLFLFFFKELIFRVWKQQQSLMSLHRSLYWTHQRSLLWSGGLETVSST